MLKQIQVMQVRHDAAGSGAFGSRRGTRTHTGVDYHCEPGAAILSPVDGTHSFYGYCYSNDLQWRYVQITDKDGNDHRLFYCTSLIPLRSSVKKDEPIGIAQDISKRYHGRGMLPHVHYEIRRPDKTFIDPEIFAKQERTQ